MNIDKYIQIAFATVIFLNLTNLFVFTSAWVGLSLQLTGGVLFLGAVFYLLWERRLLVEFLRKKIAWLLILLFFIWPLIATIPPMFQGYSLVRELVLQAFYMALILGTVLFVWKNGFVRTRWLIWVCHGVTIFGIFAEQFLPGFFYSVATKSADAVDVFAVGRAGGFHINPNNAARFTILMYILLTMSPKPQRGIVLLALSLVTFGAVLFTASRSSILIAAVVIIAVLGLKFAFPRIQHRFAVDPIRLVGGLIAGGLFAMLIIAVVPSAARYALEETAAGERRGTAERLEFFTRGASGFIEGVVREAEGRWYTVEPYLDGFQESWIMGKGTAGYRIYRLEKRIPLTPHNTIFAIWMDYGVIYLGLVFLLIGLFLFSKATRRAEQHVGLLFSVVIVLCLFGISFTFDALMNQRGFYALIGIWVALCAAPERWYAYDTALAHNAKPSGRKKPSLYPSSR